jgi:WD40 repeat protein
MKNRYGYFNYPVTCVNSSFDNSHLVASCKDHTAAIWNTDSNRKLDYLLCGSLDVITCTNFLSQNLVATTSYDLTFRIFKLD